MFDAFRWAWRWLSAAAGPAPPFPKHAITFFGKFEPAITFFGDMNGQ